MSFNESAKKTFLKETFVVLFLAITAFILFVAEKIFDYSAAPTGDKDCDFIFPGETSRVQPASTPAEVRPPFALAQSGGFINDASCLNKTQVYGIVRVKTLADIQNALQFARDNQIKMSVAGQRHSMGGQSFVTDGLVLDMRDFNHIALNKKIGF